jgi:hypothetical protein
VNKHLCAGNPRTLKLKSQPLDFRSKLRREN